MKATSEYHLVKTTTSTIGFLLTLDPANFLTLETCYSWNPVTIISPITNMVPSTIHNLVISSTLSTAMRTISQDASTAAPC